MRLKSEIWVKAYLRRCAGENAMGVVVRRGDADAGTIFIKISRLDGTADLYVPAPAGLASADGERQWIRVAEKKAEAAVDAQLDGERRMDPDVWIIEIEDRDGRGRLDDWLAPA